MRSTAWQAIQMSIHFCDFISIDFPADKLDLLAHWLATDSVSLIQTSETNKHNI